MDCGPLVLGPEKACDPMGLPIHQQSAQLQDECCCTSGTPCCILATPDNAAITVCLFSFAWAHASKLSVAAGGSADVS